MQYDGLNSVLVYQTALSLLKDKALYADSSTAEQHDRDEFKKNLKGSSRSSMETKSRKREKHDGVQKKPQKNNQNTPEAASKRTTKHDEVLIKKRKQNNCASPVSMFVCLFVYTQRAFLEKSTHEMLIPHFRISCHLQSLKN